MEEKLTMSVEEMAKELGISKPMAYNLVNTEGFPVIHIGRRKIILVDGFKKWLIKNIGKQTM